MMETDLSIIITELTLNLLGYEHGMKEYGIIG